MAGRRPVSSLISSVTRPSLSNQYICRPCQHALSLQQQQPHTQTTAGQQQQHHQTRSLHRSIKPAPVPSPTPFVPDVPTFLTLIGRKLKTHAAKFQSWDDLFTLSSPQLKELGIEPARSRRYLLRWREKFRKGEYGIGGDMTHVSDGAAELRVLEVPSLRRSGPSNGGNDVSVNKTPGMTKLILNVPAGQTSYTLPAGQTTRDLKKPNFVQLVDGQTIVGSYVQPAKGSAGSVATLKVTEGLWEDKRGRKVYGGERRRAETLHKMRVEERKKNER